MAEEEHKGPGRPSVMTEAVVAKMEQAFSNGCNDTEACVFAGVSRDALYDYIKKHPEFGDKKEALKNLPNLAARQVVVKAIKDGDLDAAEWWLERKARDEFATRKETTGAGGGPIQTQEVNPEDVKPEDAQRAYSEAIKNARGTE